MFYLMTEKSRFGKQLTTRDVFCFVPVTSSWSKRFTQRTLCWHRDASGRVYIHMDSAQWISFVKELEN